jgi:hypothetical protein
MSRSHASPEKPTSLLALIALGLVFRFKPAWVAVDLGTAAAEAGVRPQRLSRLVTRVIDPFEAVVARLTRRGRPGREDGPEAISTELALTQELLGVSASILRDLSPRGTAVRERLIGAFERLQQRYPLTQQRFCETLGIAPRTFRHWLTQPRRAGQRRVAPSAQPTPRPPRPLRRGRFGFDVTLPATQFAADTTDLVACGVPLKLVAAQDVGGRDAALFDAVIVDDHESAEHVAQVLDCALADAAGAQLITDQGTPYLATRTREALVALDVEHAPQKEGDPLGKATVERAFRAVKDIARPLFALTNQAATAMPALHCASLARALATVVITALLRAYQHGARAARVADTARGDINPDELARRAEVSREHARATDRSARLLLTHVHELYAMPGSVQTFVNSLRRYPLVVLHDAERALRQQAHRTDIRDRKSYFSAIVRNLCDEYRKQRERETQARAQQVALRRQHHEHAQRMAAFHADPLTWLRHALDLLAMQWLPDTGELLFGGIGLGQAYLLAALERLALLHGADAVADLARGALHDFRLANADRLGPHGAAAIAALLERSLETLASTPDCAALSASAMLLRTGKSPRPPPPNHLRI